MIIIIISISIDSFCLNLLMKPLMFYKIQTEYIYIYMYILNPISYNYYYYYYYYYYYSFVLIK